MSKSSNSYLDSLNSHFYTICSADTAEGPVYVSDVRDVEVPADFETPEDISPEDLEGLMIELSFDPAEVYPITDIETALEVVEYLNNAYAEDADMRAVFAGAEFEGDSPFYIERVDVNLTAHRLTDAELMIEASNSANPNIMNFWKSDE